MERNLYVIQGIPGRFTVLMGFEMRVGKWINVVAELIVVFGCLLSLDGKIWVYANSCGT